jgi:trans-2-enoyl-CoA reductase
MEKIPANSPAVLAHRFGRPEEVAEYGLWPVHAPGPGEALVELEAAPVNPADVNVLEGKYGILPHLPAVPGVEGVGLVRVLGGPQEPHGPRVGQRVLLPHGLGTWRRWMVARTDELVGVPEGVPVEQAAMLRINPATAWCMLREIESLPTGAWVVQNAANSGVGRAVIQIARAMGLRTVSVVRRAELVEELLGQGADAVVLEGEGLKGRVLECTGGERPVLGLNAVGGESALSLAGCLEEGASLVTYGAMGRQPLRIPNGLLIFQDIRFRGFWVTRWYRESSAESRRALFAGLFEWARQGVLRTPVEAIYGLSEIRAGLVHAQRGGRGGKVLLRPEGES